MIPTETDWKIRHYVYQVLTTNGCAPEIQMIAGDFAISAAEAQQALQQLHDAHALVLSSASGDILMAHPLSAVPTDYRVIIANRELYANCAWDSLGIPAMLAEDARIEARHSLTGEIVNYSVTNGELAGAECGLVHFALPFSQWYGDIVDT